jgi:hypothetical protein
MPNGTPTRVCRKCVGNWSVRLSPRAPLECEREPPPGPPAPPERADRLGPPWGEHLAVLHQRNLRAEAAKVYCPNKFPDLTGYPPRGCMLEVGHVGPCCLTVTGLPLIRHPEATKAEQAAAEQPFGHLSRANPEDEAVWSGAPETNPCKLCRAVAYHVSPQCPVHGTTRGAQ